MKIKYLGYKPLIRLMSLSVLCLLVYSSSVGIALGQKKPKSVPLDPNIDDKQLCLQESLKTSQVCDLFALYNANKDGNNTGKTIALNARNDMIDVVVGQVDSYFKLRKDGRRTKIRFYETVLDFLRIGGELAVTIMNGERAKTIVGAALAGLDTGRTKYDKNFEVLQTQVLVNKMITKRAQTLTEIYKGKDKPVRAVKSTDAYSWIEAKNDLRKYLLAGTFDDALDALVQDTGDEAVNATNALSKAANKNDVNNARKANTTLAALSEALDDPAKKAQATAILETVFESLKDHPEIGPRLTQITAPLDGKKIWQALFDIRSHFVLRTDLVNLIDDAINEAGQSLQ